MTDRPAAMSDFQDFSGPRQGFSAASIANSPHRRLGRTEMIGLNTILDFSAFAFVLSGFASPYLLFLLRRPVRETPAIPSIAVCIQLGPEDRWFGPAPTR